MTVGNIKPDLDIWTAGKGGDETEGVRSYVSRRFPEDVLVAPDSTDTWPSISATIGI